MNQDDVIVLTDGQTVKILKGDESDYENCYIVELKNGDRRVIDRETLTLATILNNPPHKHAYKHS